MSASRSSPRFSTRIVSSPTTWISSGFSIWPWATPASSTARFSASARLPPSARLRLRAVSGAVAVGAVVADAVVGEVVPT